MFSKGKKNDPKKVIQEPPAPPSIISRDLKITGDLYSDGEIQIDGAVTGDIRTKNLMVGETAVVKGEIFAQSVRVHGTIDGQIKAKIVKLAATAHVVGDILHEDLSIETGAFLEGNCKRMAPLDEKALQPEAPAAKQPAADAPAAKGHGPDGAGKPAQPPAYTVGKPLPANTK